MQASQLRIEAGDVVTPSQAVEAGGGAALTETLAGTAEGFPSIRLKSGLAEDQLRLALAPHADVRVLHFSNATKVSTTILGTLLAFL